MNIVMISLGSAVISFVFAVVAFNQFFARRKPYQIICPRTADVVHHSNISIQRRKQKEVTS
jgi:hypothetical protein